MYKVTIEHAGLSACYNEVPDDIGVIINEILNINENENESKEDTDHESLFPAIVGAPAEMFVNGEWIRGKIVEGYRFDDGIVTIETEDGKQYWCGQSRTDLYREVEE